MLTPMAGAGIAGPLGGQRRRAWTPLLLNPVALYDYKLGPLYQDAAGTIPAGVGDPVGCWPDLSGNGYHATQATLTKQAVLVEDGLHLDGVDDLFAASFRFGSQATVLAVLQSVSGNASTQIIVAERSSTKPIPLQLDINLGYPRVVARGNNGIMASYQGGALASGGKLLTATRDGNRVALYDNNALLGSAENNLGTIDPGQVSLGASVISGDAGFYYAGVISALLAFDRVLSPAEISQTTQYYADREGIPL